MTMKRLALLALTCAACGSLSKDPGARPVLATLHGELTNPQSMTFQAASGVRVAVVWINLTNGYSTAEDLPVQPVFPSAFRIDLTSPPPEDAMVTKAKVKANDRHASSPGPDPVPGPTPAPPSTGNSHPLDFDYDDGVAQWPEDFAFAVGAVVAYEDLNQNGKLDLVDEGATAYVDRIAGANETTILTYFQGTLPADRTLANGVRESQFRDGQGQQPQLGYNLFHEARCAVTLDTGPAASTPPCTDVSRWLGMDTLYTLPLTSDPKWGNLMCKKGTGGFGGSSSASASADPSGGPSTPPSPPRLDAGLGHDAGAGDAAVSPDPSLPAAGDPKIQCSPDGKSFTYDCHPAPPPPPRLCGAPQLVDISCGGRAMPNPPPPNWPCTVH
jgi:hypothetical protein